jgi:2-dehydropantoate 2-reductase
MSKTEKKKIAVIGAGAIGSLVGGILAHHGEDVTLIGRKEHAEAVESNGLLIDGVLGEFKVAIKTAEQLKFKPDMVFVAVKTQDLKKICEEIKPNVRGVPIVLMQNGVRSVEIAAAILGKASIVSCILMLNAQCVKPGRVTYINKKPVVIGEAFGDNGERVAVIQSLLQNVSETIISDNIVGAQWTKLLINAMANGIDGMTGLSLGEYVANRQMRNIGVRILKEALTILDKATIQLGNLPGIPLFAFKTLIKLPTPVAAFLLQFALRFGGNTKIITSTLQSLRKGRKTEIDYLNGEFVNLGKKIDVPAPYNATVVKLVHEIECTQLFYRPEELSRHFGFSANS